MASVDQTGATGTDPAIDARIGMVLQGRYRILSPLGDGGMGTVYRAERLQLGRLVAVKFLHDWFLTDAQLLKRFEIEAHAMGRLTHPNCVSVIDFGVEGSPYLVMELVTGQTLRTTLSEGVVPASRAIRIARQVLAGLGHAHAQGIVHRDVKPENIILEQSVGIEDHVRLLDFGMAKLLDREANLTRGLALGTPNYMAPEQLGVGRVDERTDVYAVGIVLFEMLTGQKPFQHPDVAQIFQRQLHMPPPPLRQAHRKARYSAELEAVLLRAMAKAQDQRFSSAAALTAALEAVPEAARGAAAAPAPAGGATSGASSEHSDPVDWGAYEGARAQPLAAPGLEPTVRDRAPSAPAARPAPRTARSRTPGQGGAAAAVQGPRRAWRNLVLASLAVAGLAGAGLLLWGRQDRHADKRAPLAAAPPQVRPPARVKDSTSDLAQVRALLRAGDREGALRLLADVRREHPSQPDAAALQAQLYFEKFWWSEGAAAFRVAVQNDPARAKDRVLLTHLVSSLQSPRFHRKAASMLREIGDPARPLVEAAAARHESPSVRTRAASLLQTWPRGAGAERSQL